MPSGNQRPIAYASKTLTATEKGYSQIEKEGLGIIFRLKKFYRYLWGCHFTLVTLVIEKLEVSLVGWAAPVVPVLKTRVCCDFNVTVNPHLIIDEHPINVTVNPHLIIDEHHQKAPKAPPKTAPVCVWF